MIALHLCPILSLCLRPSCAVIKIILTNSPSCYNNTKTYKKWNTRNGTISFPLTFCSLLYNYCTPEDQRWELTSVCSFPCLILALSELMSSGSMRLMSTGTVWCHERICRPMVAKFYKAHAQSAVINPTTETNASTRESPRARFSR